MQLHIATVTNLREEISIEAPAALLAATEVFQAGSAAAQVNSYV
jgi:hypothetical protein